MNTAAQTLIHLDGVTKVFFTDEVETHALAGIHLEIKSGEYIAIAGPSLRIKANAQAYLRELAGVQQAANNGALEPSRRPRRRTPVHE